MDKIESVVNEMGKQFRKTADLFEERSKNESFLDSFVHQIHVKQHERQSLAPQKNTRTENSVEKEQFDQDPYNLQMRRRSDRNSIIQLQKMSN